MAVVTISRLRGSGAQQIGHRVAGRLGCRLVDHEVLDMVAEKAGVSSDWVKGVDHLAGSLITRLISEIVATDVRTRHLRRVRSEFDENAYREFLKRAIEEIAAGGNAVIIGRGGQFILKGYPRAVHVLLVAQERDRVALYAEKQALDPEKAQNLMLDEEKKRIAFLEGYQEGDPGDPIHYHMAINTSRIGFETAVDLICDLVAEKDPSM